MKSKRTVGLLLLMFMSLMVSAFWLPQSKTKVYTAIPAKEQRKTVRKWRDDQLNKLDTVSDKVLRSQMYIERFKHVADTMMNRYGVPAPLTLVQGLLESSAGASEMSLAGNNHFGIKRGGPFSIGHSKWGTKEYRKGKRKSERANFSEYETVWDSYASHSALLTSGKHFKKLKDLWLTPNSCEWENMSKQERLAYMSKICMLIGPKVQIIGATYSPKKRKWIGGVKVEVDYGCTYATDLHYHDLLMGQIKKYGLCN